MFDILTIASFDLHLEMRSEPDPLNKIKIYYDEILKNLRFSVFLFFFWAENLTRPTWGQNEGIYQLHHFENIFPSVVAKTFFYWNQNGAVGNPFVLPFSTWDVWSFQLKNRKKQLEKVPDQLKSNCWPAKVCSDVVTGKRVRLTLTLRTIAWRPRGVPQI